MNPVIKPVPRSTLVFTLVFTLFRAFFSCRARIAGVILAVFVVGCAPLTRSPGRPAPDPVPKTDDPALVVHPVPPVPAQSRPARSARPLPHAPQAVLPVREILRLPARPLPAALETRILSLEAPTPLPFHLLAQRLADAAKTTVLLEDRPPRDGKPVALPAPPWQAGHWQGGLRDVLDNLARAGGYDWRWDKTRQAIVLIRWRDAQGAREAVPATPDAPRPWAVRPARNKTLKGVVTAWAHRAGWHLVWEPDAPDYAVTTEALFDGSFADAVGALLLATARTERPIVPVAYPVNRQIVIGLQK